VSPHLTAVFLAIYAGCALLGMMPAAVLAAGHPVAVAFVLAVTAFTVTVLIFMGVVVW
jgi:hypothetical protein